MGARVFLSFMRAMGWSLRERGERCRTRETDEETAVTTSATDACFEGLMCPPCVPNTLLSSDGPEKRSKMDENARTTRGSFVRCSVDKGRTERIELLRCLSGQFGHHILAGSFDLVGKRGHSGGLPLVF